MTVTIHSPAAVQRLRRAGRAAASTLQCAAYRLQPGTSVSQTDRWVKEHTNWCGGRPSQLSYHGVRAAVCVSINKVVCHGIPGGDRTSKAGDIVNVDVTTELDGFHGDASPALWIGEVSEAARLVVQVAKRCLALSIQQLCDGARLGDIGAAIQHYAQGRGCRVVRDYGGHGIGGQMHLSPHVPRYGNSRPGRTACSYGHHHRAHDNHWRTKPRNAERRLDGRYQRGQPNRAA